MSEPLSTLLQWSGWAGLGGIIVALVTLAVKARADQRTLGVEQAKVAVQARTAEIAAAQVIVQERTAEAGLQEMVTKTYQGIIGALTGRVDDLEHRIIAVEAREKSCLERLAAVEEERRRDQADFWRRRGGTQ